MFWFRKSKFNGREYREETSRKISWGHWFAFFNIIIVNSYLVVVTLFSLIGQTLLLGKNFIFFYQLY